MGDIGTAAIEAGLNSVEWPGRLQRLNRGRLSELVPPGAELWLDGGHNPAAGRALAAHLASLPPRPTHLVCGMLNTKDVAGFLRPLAAIAAAWREGQSPDAVAQAARLAALPRGAVQATRALIRGDQAEVEAALEAEAAAFEERLRSPEAQERFRAFLGRAKPGAA